MSLAWCVPIGIAATIVVLAAADYWIDEHKKKKLKKNHFVKLERSIKKYKRI